ncbi:gamma-glutamyltransferase [Marinobacterium stanieri]|uniref:gamma-glutamyltransferase n=1 Tax=Marinobacterium stanieri TaxID=49186 RepID=UPI0002E3C66F|nr:gamma-glutamyltransferase [Marinobacterium stanieri]
MMRWFSGAALGLVISLAPLSQAQEAPAPEHATGMQQATSVFAREQLVVSAHPLATQAGYAMLQQGGSAVDAALAIQAMLTLVEPQSSGIGGGAFMLYWDADQQRLQAFDGRETAPASATAKLFMKTDGTPMRWHDALVGARSVGTPGVLRMLELAHQQHGSLPWATPFQPAITRAEAGFEVSPRLHQLIASGINPGLGRYQAAREYFFTAEGEPLPVGYLRRNPALAQSLQTLAQEGADAFYEGAIGEQIVAALDEAKDNPGQLSRQDLADYRALERQPVCRPYQQWQVCGFPPPTSGGVTLLQIIGLLEPFDLSPSGDSADLEFSHLLTQASRLAYADRARYLADADFVEVPVEGLLSPAYLQQRSRLINPNKDMGQAQPGNPTQLTRSDDQAPERPSTSHFVVRDRNGNMVSMTTSIEMAFGSTLMAGGFLLNNQLTDFSFVAEDEGRPVANRVQPGKRPRSSMAPVIVFDQKGQPVLALGSPGGSRIINYVAQTLLRALHSDQPLQTLLQRGHISNRNGVTELELGTDAESLKTGLETRGHSIKVRDLNSGLHLMRRHSDGRWESGVDPRREGLALGG